MSATAEERDQEERWIASRITGERGRLAESIRTALDDVARAGKAHVALVDLFDVEVVESTVGDDVAAHLADAARSLRAAQALVKGLPA